MTARDHLRARLGEIQDLLLVAHDADGVARATLLLTAILQDEWNTQEYAAVVQLLREVFDFLNNPTSTVNIRDWTKAAEPFVRN